MDGGEEEKKKSVNALGYDHYDERNGKFRPSRAASNNSEKLSLEPQNVLIKFVRFSTTPIPSGLLLSSYFSARPWKGLFSSCF
mmetsp:Transcript_15540/g.26106  ORF Transcript_15540/g.26106 Transcript_15540/m.26106 type:complete len:83 (-) Transcript_15540:708-956(-)